jgi:hypothetical protein
MTECNPKEKQRTANMGFGVIGAGRCNLHQQQHGSSCSGRTFFNLAFCRYLQLWFFNWASVPGGRFSNSPTTPSPVRYMQPYINNGRHIMQTKALNFSGSFSNDQPCIAAHLQGAQNPTHKANLAKELQLHTHGRQLSIQKVITNLYCIIKQLTCSRKREKNVKTWGEAPCFYIF